MIHPVLITILLFSYDVLVDVNLKGSRLFKKSHLYEILGLKKNREVHEGVINLAKERLEEAFRNKGFLNARVEEVIRERKKNGITLIFKVYEGNRAFIRDFKIEVNEVGELPGLMKALKKFPRSFYYDISQFIQIQNEIVYHLMENGYPNAHVSYKITPVAPDTFLLLFSVDTKKKVIISQVEVMGLKSVRRRIVEREIQIKPPQIYRESDIRESMRRLFLTGLFQNVFRELEPLNEEGDTIRLIFRLVEGKFRYLEGGLAYRLVDEIRFNFGYGHKNLFNNSQKINVKGELYFNVFGKNGYAPRRRLEIEYTEPYFLGFPLEGSLKPFYERDWYIKKEELGIDFENRKLFRRNLLAIWGIEWKTYTYRPQGTGLITNSIVLSLIEDSRDNFFDPQRGNYWIFRAQKSGGILMGDNHYNRILFDLSNYSRLSKNLIYAQRIRLAGQRESTKGYVIPTVERFFLGGDGSVRGYEERSLGPQDPFNPRFRSGNFLYLVNLEIRWRLNSYGIVFFSDFGSLTENLKNMAKSPVYYAFGIGFRYYTLIGPIRLDWGFGSRDLSKWGRFYLGIGHMF